MNIDLSYEDWQIVLRAMTERYSALAGKDPRLGFGVLQNKCLDIEQKITTQIRATEKPSEAARLKGEG